MRRTRVRPRLCERLASGAPAVRPWSAQLHRVQLGARHVAHGAHSSRTRQYHGGPRQRRRHRVI